MDGLGGWYESVVRAGGVSWWCEWVVRVGGVSRGSGWVGGDEEGSGSERAELEGAGEKEKRGHGESRGRVTMIKVAVSRSGRRDRRARTQLATPLEFSIRTTTKDSVINANRVWPRTRA